MKNLYQQIKSNHIRYQKKTRNFTSLTYHLKVFLALAIFTTSPFYWLLPTLANTAPGTTINNTATGSFEDSNNPGTVTSIESNTVSVTVAEVAGITITQSAIPEEAPSGVTDAGANQDNGEINPDDIIYFTYKITNVGNDPTQFFIPDAPSNITNGSLSGDIQIIEYDPDGASAVDLTSNNITVPNNGATTGTLLNGVANSNDGSVPVGGSITIRVPVKADSNSADGDNVTVIMGDTGSNDNSAATQNQVYAVGTNDVYTQDNSDGTTGETNGNPVNGDATNHRQEASFSQEVTIVANPSGPVVTTNFCSSAYNMIYSGHFPNRIDAIHVDSGASVPLTTSNIAANTNSLASDHINNLVYYAENQSIYAWSPITNTHTVITSNIKGFAGTSNISSLSSGGAAFYNGSLYLGIDENQHTGGAEVYKVDFVPGSNGQTVQSVTSLNIASLIPPSDWGDLSIDNNGVILSATPDGFWTYNLNNGTYTSLSSNLPGGQHQLAKDGQGRLWAVVYTPTKFIFQVQVVGNSIQQVGQTISVDPHDTNDAAECVIGESSIGDRVWNDANENGVQDAGEDGIENVTVDLYWDINGNGQIDNGDDPVLATQTTGTDGNYDFPDLIFGNYIVKVSDTNGVLTNASLTSASDTHSVNLLPGTVDYNDADFGYKLAIASNPDVILVKRITKINDSTTTNNGDNLLIYNQEESNPYDDNKLDNPAPDPIDTDKWLDTTSDTSSTFLIGGINGGTVKPDDELEYTIYYLSAGDTEAENVLFCDRVPENVSFIPTSFNGEANKATGGLQNADRGIQWLKDGNTESLTNVQDGDVAQYFPPGVEPSTLYPKIKCDGTNTNGAVVVNLGNLPNATAPGTPNTSYGFVRFRGRVK